MLVALLIIGYFIMAGATFETFRRLVAAPHFRHEYDEVPGSMLFGVFWVIALPFIIGAFTTNAMSSETRKKRVERKRQREIDAANHKAELKRIEARATRELEQALGFKESA